MFGWWTWRVGTGWRRISFRIGGVRRARGFLVLPADAMAEMPEDKLPAFVPVSVEPDSPGPSAEADRTGGVITIEFGHDLVLRVPGDVPAARAAAVVHALRGTP